MHALVTGGAGFIGSNIVDALLARGDRVTVVDDLSTGRSENLTAALAAGATLLRLDIVAADELNAAFAAARPDVVFHLAAQIDVRRSVADPAADARINVEGTVNVLEAARVAGARRVVLSSTGGAIYGEADTVPTPEDAPIRPLSPYGQAKYAGEGYARLFTSLRGLSTAVLRYSNVYGPRQDPLGEGGVIAIFCGKLASGGQPTVFGDGRQTRDYVYVEDVVRANLTAAGADAAGPWNVGTGVETSVLDLVEVVRGLGDDAAAFTPRFEPPRAGEVGRSCLDVTRAREQLGWEPRVPLAEGLLKTLAHVGAGAVGTR
ncbi:NAD-dependent epimerase/dehydratase family protein [Conexibacter sp. CPCC 206217]|uniref:NAD-dependent epimerase/dehydratase family protein n=1 Tax=Conexibacter sp. CPCC 206217 TaxID=3064574 RepID=UPI00271EEC16|nr:NAD-dependent epimerase/dehydratase family protein [Conexibacter sp. CPCC 206217]MDO8209859.1 GDP-mannose 4,6-dehydratase [Conexibacter sp. CPCC 206217]